MKRNASFFDAVAPAVTVVDARFGLRQLPKNNEEQSIFSYSSPGTGPNGEHQN